MRPILISIIVFAGLAYSQKLPDYIVPCVRTKPDFNKCAYDHALEAIPHMLKGDRRFKIPVLAPLNIPKVSLQPNKNLKITLNDLVVYGIDNFDLKDIKIDFDQRNIKVSLYSDVLTVIAQYEIDGRLLVPLRGSGPCNITIVNVDIEYNLDFDVVQKNGQDYLTIKKDDLKLVSKKAYYHLENLFGNQQLRIKETESNPIKTYLSRAQTTIINIRPMFANNIFGMDIQGDETNKILNENDREVGKELNGPVTETIRSIVTTLIKNYLTDIPMDEIFLKE